MNLPKTDIAPSLLVLFGSVVGLIFTNNIDTSESGAGITFGPYFYPSLILWMLLLLSTALLAKSVLHRKKYIECSEKKEIAGLKVTLLFIILIIYTALFFNFGFLYSSMLALFALQIIFGRKKNIITIIISIVMPTILYFLFTYLFDISLP